MHTAASGGFRWDFKAQFSLTIVACIFHYKTQRQQNRNDLTLLKGSINLPNLTTTKTTEKSIGSHSNYCWLDHLKIPHPLQKKKKKNVAERKFV